MTNNIPCIVAVDVGGTSTKTGIYQITEISQKPIIIKKINGETGSPAVTKNALNNIRETIDQLLHNLPDMYQVKHIQMGISGIGTVADKSLWENYFTELYHVPVSIDSDAAAALFSLLEDKYPNGIVALSGTGSSAAGIKNGHYHMVGGFGNLIRERGSAYAIVHQLCLSIIEKVENGKKLSILEKGLLKEMKINDGFALKSIFFNNTKTYIASFATYIQKMAEQGNKEAIKVISKEGIELAKQVIKIIKVIKIEDQDWLGIYGSCIRENNIMKEAFFSFLEENNYHLSLHSEFDELLDGVYYHGLKIYREKNN